MAIQGAGSFALEESPATPGYYSIRIDADRFEEGVTYGYHFSDSPNGPDMAPSWSGTIAQPGAEEDDEEKFGEYYLICIACGAVPLVLLIAFVFFASRGGRKVSEE